jgi:hypothetical protein
VERADYARRNAIEYVVNPAFTQATLRFADGSHIQFEHTSRSNRWAHASAPGTVADDICRSLSQFRLNAKHLQLFFDDGTNAEFL